MNEIKRVSYEHSAAAAGKRNPEMQKKLDEMNAWLRTDSDGWEGKPNPELENLT